MRPALRVEAPLATKSDTAPITARSVRLQRPVGPSGNQPPHPDLGDPHADGADTGDERAFPVAVAGVPLLPAHDVGLGAHDLVGGRFGHGPYELPHIDHPVVESGHLGQGEGDFG